MVAPRLRPRVVGDPRRVTACRRGQRPPGAFRTTTTSSTSEKVRENKLRRMAERQRLRLEKSRRRDPLAYDYGTYMLVDPWNSKRGRGREPGPGVRLEPR
jgi:hypothetical protein